MSCAAVLAMAGAVSLQLGGDTVAAAPHPQGGAVLCYHNVDPPKSRSGDFALEPGGLPVTGRMEVGAGPGERLEVVPPAGWFVWPAEDAAQVVPDGGTVTVRIIGGVS